jgi:hypothetical protein
MLRKVGILLFVLSFLSSFSEDPKLRFCRGSAISTLIASNKQDVKPSFSIHLFQAGFSINGNNFRPYDHIGKSFLECIDQGFIPPGLVEDSIVSKTNFIHFYDGNIVIELQDFRYATPSDPQPVKQLILLKPGPEVVTSEVNAL